MDSFWIVSEPPEKRLKASESNTIDVFQGLQKANSARSARADLHHVRQLVVKLGRMTISLVLAFANKYLMSAI